MLCPAIQVAMAVADRVVIEAMGYPQEEAEASVHAAVGVASHLEVEEGKAISLHEVDREVSLREVVAGRQNPVVRGEEDVADRSVKNVEPMTTTKRMRLLTVSDFVLKCMRGLFLRLNIK